MIDEPKMDASTGQVLNAIHPEGTFPANLVAFGDIRQSQNKRNMYMQVLCDTSEGRVFSYFVGSMDTLMFLYRKVKLPVSVRVKITHQEYQDRTYLSAQIME
jgi:hypothetical protein